MKFLRKIRLFVSLDFRTMYLLVEAFFYLAIGRLSKAQSFSILANRLGSHGMETTFEYDASEERIIGEISNAIHLMSRYTFWESACMVRAIAAMKMLERRHIPSTMYYGTRRDESKSFIAHAWLRSGPFYVTGAEEMNKFTVVSMFARTIDRGSKR